MLKNDKNPLLTDWLTSNTKKQLPIPADDDYGVDWITLRIDLDPSSIDLSSPMWTVTRKGKVPDPDITYDCYYIKIPFGQTVVDGQFYVDSWRIYLSFNPSTALFGKSKWICPVVEVAPLVGKLLDHCSPLFMPVFDRMDDQGTITRDLNWEASVWLSRIDCARNIYIDDPIRFQEAIAAAQAKNAKTKSIHTSGKRGWTVENKTATVGLDRVYNKDAELARHGVIEERDPALGVCFRFEAQLRADRIDKFGLRYLSSISDEKVWNAIESRWNDCRWNVKFAEPGTFGKAISHLSASDKTGLFGYLGKHQYGFLDDITESAERKYGAICKTLGFIPGKPIETMGAATRVADIFAGRVIDLEP